MPVTDLMQRLREAVVSILDGLGAVQAITGRSAGNVVAWDSLEDAPRPVLAYLLHSFAQVGESGDARDGVLQVTAVAEGNGADAIVNALLEAVEQGLTAEALYAAGVDASPVRLVRHEVPSEVDGPVADGPRGGTRNLHAGHLDIELTTTS